MSRMFWFGALSLLLVSLAVSQDRSGDDANAKQSRETLKEPVFRISKARIEAAPTKPVPPVDSHPLDPAIQMARDGLERIRSHVNDYSCTLVKQERIDGELYPPEYMYAEIRNHREKDGQVVTPFSVYMYFLKPDKMKGREVIYVEGQNEGSLVAHEGSGLLRSIGVVKLKPDGPVAMRGNRYPITEVGVENLISQLIQRGERDRKRGECTVEFKDVKINNRPCTMLEVVHPHPRPYFDFHIARIFIDEELGLPVRYEAYTWPSAPGGQPELQECYTYLNLKVNIGLKDSNFDPQRFRL